MEHRVSGAPATIPGFLVLHHRKLQFDHDIAFSIMVQLVPELATRFFVSVSDAEFRPTFPRHFKKSFVAADENHMLKASSR